MKTTVIRSVSFDNKKSKKPIRRFKIKQDELKKDRVKNIVVKTCSRY